MTLCGTYHDFQDAIEAWGRQGFPGQQHLVVADELTGLAHQTPELEKFLNRFYELLRYIDSGGPMAVLMIGNPVPEELEEEPDGEEDPAGSSVSEELPSWEASGAGV